MRNEKKKKNEKEKKPCNFQFKERSKSRSNFKNFSTIFEKVSNKVCFICYHVATFP